MAHFSELDENNIVKQTIVVSNQDTSDLNGVEVEEIGIAFCKKLFGANTKWKQTSYNNNFRCRYASPGMTYNEEYDVFLNPQPYSSWILNTDTYEWEAPVSQPEITEEQKENFYYYEWNETNLSWDFKQRENLAQNMV